MLPLIDCDINYLCPYDSSLLIECGIVYCSYHVPWIDFDIVIYVLLVLTHVALDWLRHCLSVLSWFYLMLPWIDCDIVYQYSLCHGSSSCCIGLIVTLFSQYSHGSTSCCLGLIVTLFISILCSHGSHVASCCMLPWIDCDIVYQYSHGSSSCCLGLLWHCYLCYHGSYSCCLGLIETLFISVLMDLPHVALDWLRHYLSVLWFFLMFMLHCLSVFFGCCIGLIVTLFISILMVLLHVALVCDIVY